MIPLAAMQFLNFKNILLVLIVVLAVALFYCNLSNKVRVSELKVENSALQVSISQQKTDISTLKANNSLLQTSIDIMKTNEIVYKKNIDGLMAQIKANDSACAKQVENCKKNCDIYKTSYNECIDPKKVPSVDRDSSKKYIEVLNGTK